VGTEEVRVVHADTSQRDCKAFVDSAKTALLIDRRRRTTKALEEVEGQRRAGVGDERQRGGVFRTETARVNARPAAHTKERLSSFFEKHLDAALPL
jgi:hypothetical protein